MRENAILAADRDLRLRPCEGLMLFEFDSDQRQWQDYVRKVVSQECPPALVRAVADEGPAPEVTAGDSEARADAEALWKVYVELGWTDLFEPAETIELAIVLEELGRATDPTPYLATMSQFLPLAGPLARPGQTGAAVLDGVTATRDGQGWRLRGTGRHVLDADRAEQFAVVTDTGTFVLPAGEVEVVRTESFDPVLHLCEVRFDGVGVSVGQRAGTDPERARHVALTGLALTMVGACRRVLDLTLDHVRTREQFGRPIGAFQAVQHKAADMHVAVERARALGYFAALTIAGDDPRRRRASAMAKAAAGECQSLVFRNGLQLFGGMGFTWENDLQFALKRAKAGELMLGGAAEHRQQITQDYLAEVHLARHTRPRPAQPQAAQPQTA
jgi:alkylation response protein AidB-like acyl-CoA dehydrogenase